MAYGLPVVASNFFFLERFIKDTNSGVLINNPESIDEYKKAFDKLKDKKLVETLSYNARKGFENKFNWEKEEEKLLKFYEKILEIEQE